MACRARDLSRPKDTYLPRPMRTIRTLYRYPVKGLSPESLDKIELRAGHGIPLDREFALTNGSWAYDAQTYQPRPKSDFLMLMQHERLAALRTQLDAQAGRLSVLAPDGERIEAALDDPAALDGLAAFVGRHVGKALPGTPRLVRAQGARFTDVSVVSPALMNAISLINLATVRDVASVLGKEVNPLRFRANVYFDGGEPWEELGWLDREIRLGGVRCRVVMRTRRCAATNVDPETGVRDLGIPQTLLRHFRHGDLGVYAEVLDNGGLQPGDALTPPTP